MIDTTETPISAPPVIQTSAWSVTLAVALMSFAALLLELSLTRLFSVVLFYHFAFLAISIALLGLGAGAVFAYLRRQWLARWSVGQLGARLCVANAIFIFVVLEIVVHTAGFVASRLAQLLAIDFALPGFSGTVFRYRASVLRHLRASSRAHHAALWRRSAGRLAGLPGVGAAAERCRRS